MGRCCLRRRCCRIWLGTLHRAALLCARMTYRTDPKGDACEAYACAGLCASPFGSSIQRLRIPRPRHNRIRRYEAADEWRTPGTHMDHPTRIELLRHTGELAVCEIGVPFIALFTKRFVAGLANDSPIPACHQTCTAQVIPTEPEQPGVVAHCHRFAIEEVILRHLIGAGVLLVVVADVDGGLGTGRKLKALPGF